MIRLVSAAATLLALAIGAGQAGQEDVSVDGRPARLISNDRLTLAIRPTGGSMVQVLLKDDPDRLNPLEGLGHFVCVDGFGPVSAEERAAGLPGHGEAYRARWEVQSWDKADATLTVRFTVPLPLVQEVLRRTIRLVDGEQVVYVESELESLLAFDRPINWAEHATIGGAFLEQGKTVTEMSATRAMTRSHASEATDPPERHQLADYKEFTWPMAPTIDGGTIDMRIAPVLIPVMDQMASLMDPAKRLAFVTAFHPARQALFGYVFRRQDYPWIQIWDSYPGGGRRSFRGLEFATQPFDLPRREMIQANSLFDTPTYRWLPAKSTIATSFVMFYTRTPDGFSKVDEVSLENGTLTIADRAAGKKIVLAASRGL